MDVFLNTEINTKLWNYETMKQESYVLREKILEFKLDSTLKQMLIQMIDKIIDLEEQVQFLEKSQLKHSYYLDELFWENINSPKGDIHLWAILKII